MEEFIQTAMFTSININGNKLSHATNRFTTTQLSFLISCFIYLLIAHPDFQCFLCSLKYLFFYLAHKSPPDRFFLNRRTSKQRLRDSWENSSVKLIFFYHEIFLLYSITTDCPHPSYLPSQISTY